MLSVTGRSRATGLLARLEASSAGPVANGGMLIGDNPFRSRLRPPEPLRAQGRSGNWTP